MKRNVLNLPAVGLLSFILACGLFATRAIAQNTPNAQIPAAPAAGLDPSKLPDISGIHLGMPVADAKVALQKLYPNARIDAMNGIGLGPHNVSTVGMYRVEGDNTGYNQAAVEFTAPPNTQVVWHVARNSHQPHVAHANLVSVLRQKYGKETYATDGWGAATSNDSAMAQMWWAFDEQGQLVSGANIISGSPFGCGMGLFVNQTTGTSSAFYPSLMTSDTGGLSSYCASSYVGVVATMANQPIIDSLSLDIVDLALAVRSAKASDAWSKAEIEKAHQQNLQKSNQVKPQL